MHAHRQRRRLARAWAAAQQRRAHVAPLEEQLVLTDLYAYKELENAATEADAERARLWRKFGAWERRMRAYFLQERALPKHWLPQTDRHSGRTYYFNLKSGAISATHPFAEAVQQLHAQQQQAAERTLAQRLHTLHDFTRTLEDRVAQQRQDGVRALERVLCAY